MAEGGTSSVGLYNDQTEVQFPEKEPTKIRRDETGSNLPSQFVDQGGASELENQTRQALVHEEKSKPDLDDFKVLKVLGDAVFGKVMLVQKTKGERTDQLFAMKTYVKSANSCRLAGREKEVLTKSKVHPFIVSLFCTFQSASTLYFVLEYVCGGDLHTYMEFRTKVLLEHQARFYSSEIILGVEYLHGQSIVYRDLKLENILIAADGHIKLADFDRSKLLAEPHNKTSSFSGTKGFMAPEILCGDSQVEYGQEVDWWSLGAVMYAMLIGQSPFGDVEHPMYKYTVLTANLKEEKYFASSLTVEAQLIITQLLCADQHARLGSGLDDAAPIKNHPFFSSTIWDDVLEKKYKPPYIPSLKCGTDRSTLESSLTSEVTLECWEGTTTTQIDPDLTHFAGFSYVAPSDLDEIYQQPGSAQDPNKLVNQSPTGANNPLDTEMD